MHVLFDFNGVHEIASLSWYFCIKAKGQRKQLSYLNFLAFCLIKKQQKIKAFEKHVAFLGRRYYLAIQGMKELSNVWHL